ncbi:RNA polymerase sigma-70 factor (ECF subfamily) [Methylopila capsulata]|uniref:DNA-directed RNA polymerase sigma-70 factor n=1 Tax=Methylopila capsulata TaxID=61654 RepID=A0A9W6MQ55_9HYPH|nr:sigma-70 family RNA polymerase sigma factor [Methylopila capsulata]MBM7851267.1 RNA polymerase sigma-70 factor (ECF subfamily) [Methylopila capsulata]GLK54325.1 DNA-directed RNA polymerase sigma-70 factor [Methylopila capsulata]
MRRWNLDALFRQSAKAIGYGLVRRGMSPDAAGDIVQDAFVRLMTASTNDAQDTRQDDRPEGYLAVVARNLALDAARRERIAPFASVPPETLAIAVDPEPSSERRLADRQRLALAVSALDELPERTRRAFELNRLEGLTLAEVGRELELSTSRAGALVKEAYAHLRRRTSAGA